MTVTQLGQGQAAWFLSTLSPPHTELAPTADFFLLVYYTLVHQWSAVPQHLQVHSANSTNQRKNSSSCRIPPCWGFLYSISLLEPVASVNFMFSWSQGHHRANTPTPAQKPTIRQLPLQSTDCDVRGRSVYHFLPLSRSNLHKFFT